jgi:hypothetical protein
MHADDAAGGFLENEKISPSSGAFAGQTIGPYQIRMLLGAGGMDF